MYTNKLDRTGISLVSGVVILLFQRTISSVMKSLPGCLVEVATDVQKAINEFKQMSDFTKHGIAPLSHIEKGVKKAEMWNIRSVPE